MSVQNWLALIIILAVQGMACGQGVLHTGAAPTSTPPARPVPIQATAGGACDAGVDGCQAVGSGSGGTCDPGLVACPGPGTGYCFDLQASPDHCGSCDHACALGSPCENGHCRVVQCTSHMSTRILPLRGIGLGPAQYAGQDDFAPTDCDWDGNIDLLVFGPNDQARSVEVLHGSGDGTFVPGERYPLDTTGSSIRVADLNRDQIPDLIILIPYGADSDRVVVRLGQGDCRFGPEIPLEAGAGIGSTTLVDVDGDEIPDLVTSATDRISTFHGNGDGSFSNRQDYTVSGSRLQVAVTDWNGDGTADIVASDGYLHLLLGTGGGHFAPVIDCALKVSAWGDYGQPLILADFDGDGVVDLAGTGTVMFGMKECAFTRLFTYTEALSPAPLAAGDFNGDGATDLLVLSSTKLGLVPGDGRGGFGPVVDFGDFSGDPIGWPGTGVHVGDFNGDGRIDVTATGGTNVKVLINTCQ